MSVSYVIRFKVAAAARDEFLQLLNGVLDAMWHEEKFVNATLHVNPEDDLDFLLHETWQDHQDVIDVQLHRPYRAAWHAALDRILVAEREVSVWTPLRQDPQGTTAGNLD